MAEYSKFTVIGTTAAVVILISGIVLAVLYFKYYLPATFALDILKKQIGSPNGSQRVNAGPVATPSVSSTSYVFTREADGSYFVSDNDRYTATISQDARGNIFIGHYKVPDASGSLQVTREPTQKTLNNFRGLILYKVGSVYRQYMYNGTEVPSKNLDDIIASREAIDLGRRFYTGTGPGSGISVCLDMGANSHCLLQEDG